MPRPKKKLIRKPIPQVNSSEPQDYEGNLIYRIAKFQRAVEFLESPAWNEICEDHKRNADSLDMAWAQMDATSPQFKQMQVAKLATQAILDMKPNYEHDIKIAQEELSKFRNPKESIKKDFDDEGITELEDKEKGETAYHG